MHPFILFASSVLKFNVELGKHCTLTTITAYKLNGTCNTYQHIKRTIQIKFILNI